jgi:lipoprotein-anchoring transpeptidase ErfK/SrfK
MTSPRNPLHLATFSLSLAAASLGVLLAFAQGAQARPAVMRAPFAEASLPAGTLVISQSQRRLFLLQGDGMALSYPIAVGKAGKAWSGWARINGKYVQPDWAPPAMVKQANPRLPNLIRGGAPGNPMGARALTLDREEIAIHGTTNSMRASIGSAASFGCIRMYNEDVMDLFDRVSVGASVVAVR